MKKKIINGILLVAMLFATTSAFVSCKDTDSDVKAELEQKYAALEMKFADLQDLVSKIKSCNCDMNAINDKIAKLQAALDAINIPSLDGYLKTADLPAQVQALLGDYYTKAQVNEAIANALKGYAKTEDIPVVTPGLTQDQVNALIIAALADYAKLTDIPAAGLTQDQVQKLIDDAIAKIIIPDAGLTKTEVQKMIDDALAAFKPEIPESFTKEQIIKIIEETIETMDIDLTTIYMTEVTSISVDQVTNPMFSFNSPFGVNSNVLLAFFGEKAKRDIYFPKGSQEPIVYKGEYIIEGTGNAGKLYVTVNPSSVDFTGKTLKLMTTNGQEAPVELTPLVESDKELKYFTRGENAFYETFATIPQDKLAKAYFNWEPKDMVAFKDQIKELLDERNKFELANFIENIYNLIADNDVPAYRLQATWGENKYTYSQANIAAIAVKPLTYAFDLADETGYDGELITALEKFENRVVVWASKNESHRKTIWAFLKRFNKEANKIFTNINWSLQPTLLIESNSQVSHPDVYVNENETTYEARYDAGEITLLPTSWTGEVLAPAFKKYVVVKSINGTEIAADDPVNTGLLGNVIPGSVEAIPFTLEKGNTYKIQYSAIDYEGNIRTLNYIIKVNK